MNEINLGKKPNSTKEPMPMEGGSSSKVYYPTFYLSDIDELDSLPDGEFTFTAKGKVISSTESVRDGKRHCSCEIEIHSMTPSGGSKVVKKSKDSGDSLDEKLNEMESSKEDDGEVYEE